MAKLFIEDLKISGKKVLMRVDFNVPLENDQEIADSTKIEASLPSIKYILNQGGALILMSHLGRPGNSFDPDLSLAPCAKFLSKVLKLPVELAPDCVGGHVKKMTDKLKSGEILLLENLRFHRAEEHPEEDVDFAKELASFGDLYVNDAFGCAHRKHSSTWSLPQLFPGKAAAGYLMEKEIRFLSQALLQPKRPFQAVVGGAKISSKLGVLKSLVNTVDALLIGGGMSFTFLQALGKKIGSSLSEPTLIPIAQEILDSADQRNIPLILPVDFVIAQEISEDAETKIVTIEEGIPEGFQGLDVGPKTRALFNTTLAKGATLLWNGPVGVFELDAFAQGTKAIAKTFSLSQGVTVIAGGDTIAAVNAEDLGDKMSHISTGGGATLEFIEYGTLPGIEALSNKPFVETQK